MDDYSVAGAVPEPPHQPNSRLKALFCNTAQGCEGSHWAKVVAARFGLPLLKTPSVSGSGLDEKQLELQLGQRGVKVFWSGICNPPLAPSEIWDMTIGIQVGGLVS